MSETIAIAELVKWSAPKRVETKAGPRMLRTAAPDEAFWNAWRADKDTLRAAGVSCTKNNRTGDWEACWWLPLDEAEKAKLESALEASRATSADIEIPKPDGKEFLPFQKAGVRYALDRFAAGQKVVLIGDAMGLGKSIETIGVINAVPEIKKILLVCPASLRLNWRNELRAWLTRPFEITVIEGGKAEDWAGGEITIINYDIAQKHRKRIDAHGPYDLLILDEGHYLKNPEAQRTKAIYGAKPKRKRKGGEEKPGTPAIEASRTLVLSGTPILNKTKELWTLLEYADPSGLGKSWWSYAKRFCDARQERFGWNFDGASNLDELQRRMRSTFMIRRLKEEVLKELPPKRYQVIELPANGATKVVHEEQALVAKHEELLAQLEAAVELAKASDNPDDYAKAMDSLRKAIKISFTEMSRVRHDVAMSKVPYVIEHLENALEGGAVICFVHHKEVVAVLAEHFGDKCVTLTGDTPLAARQQAVEDFQAGKIDLFIGNIQAAGVGITLTRSSHVVFAELDWVPGNISQAADRAHRIGQVNSVLVQLLVLEGSLDANMAHKLVAKQAVITAALDKVTEFEWESPLKEHATTVTLKPKQIEKEAIAITPEQIKAIHLGLRMLAGMCDGARELDNRGFSKIDSYIGKSLAEQGFLSAKQGVLGKRLCNKYRRQLSVELLEQAGVEKK